MHTVISDTKFAYSVVFKNKVRGSGKVKKALNFFEVTIKTIDILFIQTKLTLINNCFVKLTQIRVSLHGYLCYFPVQNPIFYISYFIIQLKTCQINSYYLMKIRGLNLLSAKPTKWSNTLKHFVGKSQRIAPVCLTILWGWRLKS